MQEFHNKVAVITGANSGIGKALAKKCASIGMHVVLADISNLSEVETEIKNIPGCPSVLSVPTDVSSYDDVQRLARKTMDTYGQVHLLFNNAGVILDKKVWDYSLDDWNWILGVDLYGVIHGIKTFLPLMENQEDAAHIVNTASLAGFISSPTIGAYKAAKHAVVALTEVLYYDLASKNSHINVSLLAPSWSNTAIRDSEKHRPQHFKNRSDTDGEHLFVKTDTRDKEVRERMVQGVDPIDIAEMTLEAIQENRFYIFSDEAEARERIGNRMKTIINIENPVIIADILPR